MPKRKLTEEFINDLESPSEQVEFYDTLVKGLILRLSKSGTKSFSYRSFDGEKHQRHTIGKYPACTLAEARHQVNRHKVTELDAEQEMSQDVPDFEEIAEQFIQNHLPTLSNSTSREYKRIINRELMPVFAKFNVRNMTKEQIDKLLDHKANREGSLTMANRMRAVLSSIFSFGIDEEVIFYNPVNATKTYDVVHKRPNRHYNELEIRELWKSFGKQKQPMGELLKVLLVQGQQKNETIQMRWQDIQNNMWVIPGEISRTGEPHEVPLGNITQQIIQSLKPYSGNSTYIFASTRKKNAPLTTTKNAAQRIRKTTTVEDFKVRHLRQTVSVYMARLGVDEKVLLKLFNYTEGHNVLSSLYGKNDYAEGKKKAITKWESCLLDIL
ncbi:tyrosine-type recombinase/integrase [Fodinibius saliphilus]|uniref:tyrosine-type recombinase/integrase n=1 Tax=Fodinibius saliphilus TaxID=1920650 RepID=UPI001107E878|nr:tyrosine-type recombinase/integrase [Fodinibius saliphilus]